MLIIVVALIVVLPLSIMAYFIAGNGAATPCKSSEKNFKEKWEEEYSLLYEYDDSKND